jgi:hypothetical protein
VSARRRKPDQRSAFGSARKPKRPIVKTPPAKPAWMDLAEWEALVEMCERLLEGRQA